MQQFEDIGTEESVESELSRIKYSFATRVYNEFRTPLAHILFAVELLADNNQESTHLEQLKHTKVIKESVKQMIKYLNTLVKDIECDPN